ncbi:hypothetical protein AB1Y20_009195 [Prymnesium parvum]|uniref:Uncharacterized protein n=1 Tax=Prymnesium parvum TaxID=97485 RepID=A0AB34K356_PRYPA|mmetsp:Transcript_16536/g.41694  ORF Transcript_16536/g.41694 Transcript_16536/m.41694 type:complete len:86 (-) Transcript_16536:354-611(-)
MDMDTCCIYFCTGLSTFGVMGLLFMGTLLKMHGEWFLGLTAEQAVPASTACYLGAMIYGVYLLVCGLRLKKLLKKNLEKLDEEEM